MSGSLSQAKSSFSKMVNSRSYTRFNQSPQNPDGDASRVEVKLTLDGEEEEEEVGEGQGPEIYTKPSGPRPKPLNKLRIVFLVGGTLLVFCIGLVFGYSVHRKAGVEETSCDPLNKVAVTSALDTLPESMLPDVPPPALYWSDLMTLLDDKVSETRIKAALSKFSVSREAGSSGDSTLANDIHSAFKELKMDPWVDEHFVMLQDLGSAPNKVLFGREEMGSLRKGFLAYSKSGSREGRVVYANYGGLTDLQEVRRLGASLNGSVVLMRAGKISIAEKVMNVAKAGAVAALIYPDPADYPHLSEDTELFAHVHLGSGDPYTPGFPSFNHTQFPPAKSSGLPEIVAQSISANVAKKIFQRMDGNSVPENFKGKFDSYKLGRDTDMVTVEVNNKLVDTRIHNVFGVIKGFVDPDRYVVIGAQRDAFGHGFAKSSVGSALLMELANVFTDLVKEGFRPRRSVVFASWTAGEFGNVGITEWLEGYWASLDKKAFTYISLDGVVRGVGSFRASASPLLHTLLQETLQKVTDPDEHNKSILELNGNDISHVLKTMKMEDPAYPVMTFSGIPSVSFSFTGSDSDGYEFFGTIDDTADNLDHTTGRRVTRLSALAVKVAAQVALRLVHDRILRLDVTRYTSEVTSHVREIIKSVNDLGLNKNSFSPKWLNYARGSFERAASGLRSMIQNSDLNDVEMCRIINNRIMRVEHNFLSPYVSVREQPFRHVIFGQGWLTVKDLEKELSPGTTGLVMDQVLNQFALLTWTIQGAANDLAGDIWSLDNEI